MFVCARLNGSQGTVAAMHACTFAASTKLHNHGNCIVVSRNMVTMVIVSRNMVTMVIVSQNMVSRARASRSLLFYQPIQLFSYI